MCLHSRTERIVSWICRIVAAVILAQTLFFKFTGAEESIYIFTKVGLEPWGRYGSGVAELLAVGLLLTPRFAWAGALLALGVISGALVSHLTVLGIVVKDDGGLLFGLAITSLSPAPSPPFCIADRFPLSPNCSNLNPHELNLTERQPCAD